MSFRSNTLSLKRLPLYQTGYLSNSQSLFAKLNTVPSGPFEPLSEQLKENSIFRLPFERTFLVWEVLLALCVKILLKVG